MYLNRYSNKVIFCLIALCCASFAAYCQDIIAPGAKPAVFAPGVVSTPEDEFAPTFTPDGTVVYFSGGSDRIYFSKLVHGKWAQPKVATFSGQWKDMDPFISPDGKRLFFSSYRPLDNEAQDKPRKYAHIWYVDHLSGDNWSIAHHLDAPANLERVNNYAPSISRSGTLCFFSPSRDTLYKRKSYYAKWLGDHYDEPKPLLLNDAEVKDTFIAPDERYILFANGNDIYISYRDGNSWAIGQKLGPQVNDGGTNAAPYVSPDGKILYYSSSHTKGILMIPVNIAQNIH
jgi:Tol biopolymer transport system component